MGYVPKVIQMETGTIPPPIRFAAHFIPGGGYSRRHPQIFQAFGCSLSYVNDLLKENGQAGYSYSLLQAGLDSIWVRSDVIQTSDALRGRASTNSDLLTAYVNGLWRWPWRRELHIWEVGTEHWFQLRDDKHRLAALEDHMSCVDACFHTTKESDDEFQDDPPLKWNEANEFQDDTPPKWKQLSYPFRYTLTMN